MADSYFNLQAEPCSGYELCQGLRPQPVEVLGDLRDGASRALAAAEWHPLVGSGWLYSQPFSPRAFQGNALRSTSAVWGPRCRLRDSTCVVRSGGTKKSSDIKVSTTRWTVDPALNTFTIYAWTSTTRKITNPYDLVFDLRPNDGNLAPAKVKPVGHGILQSTLKGDDLEKLGPMTEQHRLVVRAFGGQTCQ
jgi:hypothetical protein